MYAYLNLIPLKNDIEEKKGELEHENNRKNTEIMMCEQIEICNSFLRRENNHAHVLYEYVLLLIEKINMHELISKNNNIDSANIKSMIEEFKNKLFDLRSNIKQISKYINSGLNEISNEIININQELISLGYDLNEFPILVQKNKNLFVTMNESYNLLTNLQNVLNKYKLYV